jgi:hypothetical protein
LTTPNGRRRSISSATTPTRRVADQTVERRELGLAAEKARFGRGHLRQVRCDADYQRAVSRVRQVWVAAQHAHVASGRRV